MNIYINPKYGEIWDVDFNPTRGSEMSKTRPAVVISIDAVGALPMKLVAPITSKQVGRKALLWHVGAQPSKENGLTTESTIDCLQLMRADIERFKSRRGKVDEATMFRIKAAIKLVVGIE